MHETQHKDDSMTVGSIQSSSATTETAPVSKYVPRRSMSCEIKESKEDIFLRKIKGSFNKMCSNNFEVQVPQIVDNLEDIQTNKLALMTWHNVAKIILQRAIAEPNLVQLYAGLCTKIAVKYPDLIIEEEGSEGLKFGDLFPSAYEAELQQRLDIINPDADLLNGMKEKMLSATKFVGEIGKRPQMFASKTTLLHPVSLMLKFMEAPNFGENFEGIHTMCIECACTMLNLVGKTVDMTQNDIMDDIFVKIQLLSENKNLVPRLRFMAKDLAELRGNKWLPRILTKKSDEVPTIPIGPSPSPAGQAILAVQAGGNSGDRETAPHEMSMEDAELFSSMEAFVQKLNGKSESCVANVMRQFVRSITPEQSKLLGSVFAEAPETPCFVQPLQSPRDNKIFNIRRSSSGALVRSPSSPQPLSKNFHAIINLIKMNGSATFSDELNQALVTKVSTLQASELIEVVGSIFRKMCEMPEEYNYCLNICVTLSNKIRTNPLSFQDTLESCCQDEAAIKMFNTQAALKSYLQLVHDLENELHMSSQVLKNVVGNVQNGLYELTDHEASLLAALETAVKTTPIINSHALFSSSSAPSLSVRDDMSSTKKESQEEQNYEERKGALHSRGAEVADSWSRRC